MPLLPRGVAQTMYTEIADKAAEAAAAENKELFKRLEADKLVAPKSSEEEITDTEGQTAECALSLNETMNEVTHAPIAMEDQTTKVNTLIYSNFLLLMFSVIISTDVKCRCSPR